MTTPIWPMIIHGDAESAVLDILINDTPELELSDVIFRSNLIGYDPSLRWVHVIQEGALLKWPKINRPRIDVEVYAPHRTDAKDIANICLASLFRAMGTYRGFGLFISDCELEQGITKVPDKYQATTRYVFGVRLTTTPHGSLPTPC